MVRIGSVYKKGRYIVYVTGGTYMGFNGVSNFWTYRKVKKDGTLSKREYGCYGGEFDCPLKAKVTINVEIC